MAAVGKARARRPRPIVPVGLTEDGFGILLATSAEGHPTHVVRIDAALVACLEEARTRLPIEENGGSSLSPREIQHLLRRGESVAAVAARAGVPPAWVARFETPIAWERAGMTDRARRAVFHRPRLGASGLPLGEAVRAHVALDDEAFEAAWDAVRSDDGDDDWTITFVYRTRGSRRTARWGYRARTDELRALNKVAMDLAWVPESTSPAPTRPEREHRSGSGKARPR